jgi:predicted transcriptional regulator
VTFQQIADVHQMPVENVRQMFKNRKHYFEEGVDFGAHPLVF